MAEFKDEIPIFIQLLKLISTGFANREKLHIFAA